MPLVRKPADVEQILALARGSWAPEEVDATWRAASAPDPEGGSASRLIFERMEYVFGAAAELLVHMRFEPDAIEGFSAVYAVFAEPGKSEDVVADLFADVPEGWAAEPDADRMRFDAVFADATRAVSGWLGEPAVTGRHEHNWAHALWRCGDRLVGNVQGEDRMSYSTFDAACLWTVEHSPAAELPAGTAVYRLLMGE